LSAGAGGTAEIDLGAAPAQVYAAVNDLGDGEFEGLMADPQARPRVIDALIAHMASQFRPEAAGGLEAVIHVKLWDRPGGGYDHRELVIRDGACVATDEPSHEPDLTLKVRPSDLRAIVNGDAGPRRLALRGRLRVLGDLRLGMRLSELFELG
jgi:putative sterol carrier protein